MSLCTTTRGKTASETLTRGSSRIRDEHSNSSSSCNNKVAQQDKDRMVPLDPTEAQTQPTILSVSSSNRGTKTMETSARALPKARTKQPTPALVAWSTPRRGELPPPELLQPTHQVPTVAEEAVMGTLSLLDNKISEDELNKYFC